MILLQFIGVHFFEIVFHFGHICEIGHGFTSGLEECHNFQLIHSKRLVKGPEISHRRRVLEHTPHMRAANEMGIHISEEGVSFTNRLSSFVQVFTHIQ